MRTEHLGINRTGTQVSPLDSEDMQAMRPDIDEGDGRSAIAEIRSPYIASADGLGSVPLPASLKDAVKMGTGKLMGDHPELLLDKLAERLAFERSGTRLYDAMILKCEMLLDEAISMTPDDLHRIRDEEASHMLLLTDAIEALGGDPTSQTPCADLAGVEASGLFQVLGDPRTTLSQCLHALLAAELMDGAGWETLLVLADAQGHEDLADECEQALGEEKEHLGLVQTWLAESNGLSYGDVNVQR